MRVISLFIPDAWILLYQESFPVRIYGICFLNFVNPVMPSRTVIDLKFLTIINSPPS